MGMSCSQGGQFDAGSFDRVESIEVGTNLGVFRYAPWWMLRSGSVSNDPLAETGIRRRMLGYVRSVRTIGWARDRVYGEVVMGEAVGAVFARSRWWWRWRRWRRWLMGARMR